MSLIAGGRLFARKAVLCTVEKSGVAQIVADIIPDGASNITDYGSCTIVEQSLRESLLGGKVAIGLLTAARQWAGARNPKELVDLTNSMLALVVDLSLYCNISARTTAGLFLFVSVPICWIG